MNDNTIQSPKPEEMMTAEPNSNGSGLTQQEGAEVPSYGSGEDTNPPQTEKMPALTGSNQEKIDSEDDENVDLEDGKKIPESEEEEYWYGVGREDGFTEGRDAGYEEWYEARYNEGNTEGYSAGYNKGNAEGYARGKADGGAQWILLGALAGCVLGIAVVRPLSKLFRRRKGKTKLAKTLKVVTLQGLGARDNQQDSLAATEPELYLEAGTLICVADGMGGLQNGSTISRTAVQAVISTFNTIEKSDPERMIAAMMQNANIAVNRLLSPNFGSGGTTLLIGYAREGKFYCASVGDSRICLVRDGKLIHLNRPHVLEDELILHYVNGEIPYDDARNYQKKGGLTSYLGMGSLKYVDFPLYHASILRGDRFVLMSDGVFNTLSDEELVKVFSNKPKSISAALNQKIEAKQKRFQDNYSAAVIIAE